MIQAALWTLNTRICTPLVGCRKGALVGYEHTPLVGAERAFNGEKSRTLTLLLCSKQRLQIKQKEH